MDDSLMQRSKESDAIPFGYWIGGSGELEFFIGNNGCMHKNIKNQ